MNSPLPGPEDKSVPKITLTVTPGSVTPAQRETWKRLWAKLISQAMDGKVGR